MKPIECASRINPNLLTDASKFWLNAGNDSNQSNGNVYWLRGFSDDCDGASINHYLIVVALDDTNTGH